MLSYNDIVVGKYILVDNEPYQVLDTKVFRKQQRKPVNNTKLKSLLSGKTVEKTFHQSDKVAEADVSRREMTYQYRNDKKGEVWFSEVDDAKDRLLMPESVAGNATQYIKEKENVWVLFFTDTDGEERPIGINLPIKVDLQVTEAPPNIKGNTSSGGDKSVVTETGLIVTTPLFINAGDIIRVNTDTGEYVERVEKG